ncbi:MAG TPA: LiaF domain-containing protein [bacterium]|nr:LiaF domain-containing protein [bacterium]
MKMGILMSGIIWGLFFILLGVSVIVKHLLHVDIPVVRFFFAFFLIYLGVQIILGGFRKESPSPNVVFDQGKVEVAGKDGQYNVIFGKGVIDLGKVDLKDKGITLEANTIFGSSTVKLNAAVPTLVKASAAFGDARLPDSSTAAIGTSLYKNKAYREGKPCLTLNLNVVFGEARVVEE